MYSSSDTDFRLRREKAEQEARAAYDRSAPFRNPIPVTPPKEPCEDSVPAAAPAFRTGGIGGILSRIREDDLLLLGILFLLFNENKEDDPLILIILAVLLFS